MILRFIMMKIRVILKLLEKNLTLKSIHSRSLKKLFISYRMAVVIEEFLSYVADLWAKDCAKESIWTLT